MSVESILHINVNCRNFERSKLFYELLGYKCLFDPIENIELPHHIAQGLGLPEGGNANKMVLMGLKGQFSGVLIDLMEWGEPSNFPDTIASSAAPGASRIALIVNDLEAMSKKLTDNGFRLAGPPGVAKEILTFQCCYDPDGLVLELVEFMPGEFVRDNYLMAFKNLSANKTVN